MARIESSRYLFVDIEKRFALALFLWIPTSKSEENDVDVNKRERERQQEKGFQTSPIGGKDDVVG
jgi:hypothetical protein